MEEREGTVHLHHSDNPINTLIAAENGAGVRYSYHFNQNEDFFLNLDREFIVPHLPIHHNIEEKEPTKEYISILRDFLRTLVPLVPNVFKNLIYFFDPGEILKPCFFQLFRIEDLSVLFLLRLDLLFKTHEADIVERGTNDTTAMYKTRHLFLEGELIPLAEVQKSDGRLKSFRIKPTVSETWIGETGRGYFVQGIWMDSELTKFFSKLFLPWGKRTYPYYPFICKFKTICHALFDMTPESRERHVPFFHKVLQFIEPEMESIQNALREKEFNEKMEEFVNIKERVNTQLPEIMDNITVKRYLNDRDMKEYQLEF